MEQPNLNADWIIYSAILPQSPVIGLKHPREVTVFADSTAFSKLFAPLDLDTDVVDSLLTDEDTKQRG